MMTFQHQLIVLYFIFNQIIIRNKLPSILSPEIKKCRHVFLAFNEPHGKVCIYLTKWNDKSKNTSPNVASTMYPPMKARSDEGYSDCELHDGNRSDDHKGVCMNTHSSAALHP
jgi:hypothetical protein